MFRNNDPNYVPDYKLEPPFEPEEYASEVCDDCGRAIKSGEYYYNFGLSTTCEECAESMMDNARRIAK